ESNGISKKIIAQINALRHLGMEIDICYLGGNDKDKFTARYVNEKIIEKYSANNFINKFQWRCMYQNLYKYIEDSAVKILYIRYIHFGNPFFNCFLRRLRKKGIKILLEIPTFPYDNEYKDIKWTSRIVLLIEKLSRRKFKKHVTRVVTLSNDIQIFGIPTVQISNGIDPDLLHVVEKKTIDNNIHLIGVASIGFWHGYDRVIEGLRYYYNNKKEGEKDVFFHIIGDSSNTESLRYKDLVRKYKLGNYIIFYGKKTGKELDDLFNIADIAVGSLGCHRISINNIKPLKNREYCARGIPFFYSETDEDFEHQDF